MAKFLSTGSFVLFIVIAVCVTQAQVPTPPQLDPNEWWGPAELRGKTNSTIRRFEVKFSQEMIRDLRSRLKNHRKFPPPLEGTAFEYGFNTNQLEPWVKYWAEEYNFEERQKFFNKFPHYKTNIQGLDIHFIRVKPQNSCRELKLVAEGMAAVQGDVRYNSIAEETGYFHIQATKPDTIGLALSQSPVSLLAYIFMMFSSVTRAGNKALPDGGLYTDFSREQLIDNLMMYWTPDSITSSMRIYAEALTIKYGALKIDEFPTPVPIWVLYPEFDVYRQPIDTLKFPNVLGVTQLDDGGHFVAFQLPHAFAADVFKAVNAFKAYRNAKTEL